MYWASLFLFIQQALVTNLSNVEFLKFSNGAHSVTWNYNKDEVERGIADLLNKI